MELYDNHFRCMEVNPGALRVMVAVAAQIHSSPELHCTQQHQHQITVQEVIHATERQDARHIYARPSKSGYESGTSTRDDTTDNPFRL